MDDGNELCLTGGLHVLFRACCLFMMKVLADMRMTQIDNNGMYMIDEY